MCFDRLFKKGVFVMYLAAAATSSDITSVLEILGSVFTFIIGKISDVVGVVMENPLLLIPIGVVLTSTIIAVFRRLF